MIKLHRTNFPEAMQHHGRTLARYWFEYADHYWGVTKVKYDGPDIWWEVFEADTVATVRDDYGSLGEVRRVAEEDCDLFLVDLEN